MSYYIRMNNTDIGPMSADQLMAYNVTTDTPVSRDGMPYAPLYTFPELMQLYHDRNAPAESSRRILCGIMAMLFGYLGIQYFIVGKVAGGFITILLSIVTCGLWEIVTFIQGIMMLVMTDREFNNKYVYSTSTLPLF